MKKQIISVILLVTLISLFSISNVRCEDEDDEINLGDFPQQLADRFNIALFPAQLLSSGIFLALFLFPTILLTKGKSMIAPLFIGLTVLGFCVAMGWFPTFLLLLLCLLSAIMFSGKVKGWIT